MLRNFPPKTSESTFSKLEVVSCEELLFICPCPHLLLLLVENSKEKKGSPRDGNVSLGKQVSWA